MSVVAIKGGDTGRSYPIPAYSAEIADVLSALVEMVRYAHLPISYGYYEKVGRGDVAVETFFEDRQPKQGKTDLSSPSSRSGGFGSR